MATEYVDLNLERDLVDEDFEKYQLDSTKCPINWIDNEFGMIFCLTNLGAKQIKLADDQFSYQHFITFLNHGLYKDIWVAEHAYWISENNEICLCSYDIISKKIVIKTRFTLPGHDENVRDRLYSSLSFPSKDYIICNDGCGNMYLIHTGLRHHNSHHAWKLVYQHKTFEMAHTKSYTKVVKTNIINDEKMASEPSIILDSVMLSNNTTHHHDHDKKTANAHFIILETVSLCIEERHGKNGDNDILLTKNESKNFDSIIGTDDDGMEAPPHKRIHHSGNFPKKLAALNPDEAEGKSVGGGDFNPITFVHETGVSEFSGPEKQPPENLDKTSLQDEIALTQLHTDELALVNASHKGATHFVSLLEWTTFEISNDGVSVKLKNTRILECCAPIHFASFEVRDCITPSRNKSFLPDNEEENVDSDKNQVISTTHKGDHTNQALHIVSDAPLKFIHHYVTQGSKNDDLLHHHKNQNDGNNLNLKGKQTIPPQMDPEYARFLAAQIQEEADETIEPSSNKSDDIGIVAKSEMQEISASYNMQELEECDTFPDNQSCLARYDGNTLSITHQASLSSNKYLFTALSSDDRCPLFALRHDVHATVWKPNHLNSKNRHQSIWQNILTFEALGYVIASKETRKFITAYVGEIHNKDSNHGKTENKNDKFEYQDLAERIERPTGPYCAIADFTNHIFLYFKSRKGHQMNNTTLESKEPILKNRKTGKIYGGDSGSKYAMQKLITLDYGKGFESSSPVVTNENKPNNGDLNSSTVKGNHKSFNNTILGIVLNPTNIMVLSPNRIWVVEV